MNPLALRRLELQNVLSQRREEEAAGRQELEAMKEMARLEQQEYAIRHEIIKEKQVASAQREVAKLDPEKDPQWREKYANIMADHPYAQDNKFLTENFLQLGRVNQRVLEAGYREIEENQKQTGRMALAKEKEKQSFDTLASHAASLGVDASHYHNSETGEMDWGGYTDALKTAKDSFKTAAEQAAEKAGLPVKRVVQQEGKPPTVTYEAAKPKPPDIPDHIKTQYDKLTGEIETHQASANQWKSKIADFSKLPDTEKQARGKELQQWDASRIKSESAATGTQAARNALLGQYPGLGAPAATPAPVSSSAPTTSATSPADKPPLSDIFK